MAPVLKLRLSVNRYAFGGLHQRQWDSRDSDVLFPLDPGPNYLPELIRLLRIFSTGQSDCVAYTSHRVVLRLMPLWLTMRNMVSKMPHPPRVPLICNFMQ